MLTCQTFWQILCIGLYYMLEMIKKPFFSCLRQIHLLHFNGCNRFVHRSSDQYRNTSAIISSPKSNVEFMESRYKHLKDLIYKDHEQVCNIVPHSMFAVNQINFRDVKVYGFDYDYTLAQYADVMQNFIYKQATKILVKHHHFPKDLLTFSYRPNFCIRGLHYDIKRSLLMKIDICNVIQLGTVYRGMKKLTDEDVFREFNGSRHIPKDVIDQSYVGGESLRQLMDIFSMPEMMLLANVVQYFDEKNISYDPRILFESVQSAVRDVHITGLLYEEVTKHIEVYLEKNSLCDLISYLTDAGKKLFLITNSNFHFVDNGMRHMLGNDWQEAFDVVIVQAKKPNFFKTKSRPFKTVVRDRRYAETTVSWDRISRFEKGEVYYEGCMNELMKLSKWNGTEVLYFGDQIYADLSDLSYAHGWRTGAIIPELEYEIEVMNSKIFGQCVIWIQTLERLLERMQIFRDAESQQLLHDWLDERQDLKTKTKEIFNPHFGSVFRANLSPSFFAGRLCRIADLYTSSINNLVHYSPDHFFFPVRGTLPHEHVVNLAYLHDGYDQAIEKALRERNDPEKS